MGVTIHYTLGQEEKYVKSTLDTAQKYAEEIKEFYAKPSGVPVEVHRMADYDLLINIGGCESLCFKFVKYEDLEDYQRGEWFAFKERYVDPKYKVLVAKSFCKTQFAEKLIEHKFVADIIKIVAQRCQLAYVSDEGDYYHSGELQDAAGAIEENGKMINSVAGQLDEMGWESVKSGETNIKRTGRKQKPQA